MYYAIAMHNYIHNRGRFLRSKQCDYAIVFHYEKYASSIMLKTRKYLEDVMLYLDSILP